MFSKHFGVESDAVKLVAGSPAISFPIPGVEWTAALETALRNGWAGPGLYDIPGDNTRARSGDYGPYHRCMGASDAGEMAAALRRGLENENKTNFPLEIIDHLEEWARCNQEVLVTSELISPTPIAELE